MKPFKKISLAVGVFTIAAIMTSNVMAADPLLIGYWMNSSRYGGGASYTPDMIPAEIREIVHAFGQVGSCAPIEGDPTHPDRFATEVDPSYCNANPNPRFGLSGIQDWMLHSTDPGSDFTYDQWKEVGWGGGFIAALNRAQQTGARVVLSIGGWSLSAALREAFKTDKRGPFIDSVVSFLVQAQKGAKKTFAGVDVDWEPNGNRWTMEPAGAYNVQVSASDLQNYLDFLIELKQRMVLEKSKGTFEGDIVRIAIPADPKVIEHVNKLRPGFWQAIADAIDTLNAMTYDYNGPWGSAGTTGFNSPLSSDPDAPVNQRFLNIDNTIKALLACGVPPGKFGVGAALYARVYKLGRTSGTKPYQPWNGACSMFDDPNGVITNRSIYRGINQAKTAANNFNFLAGETAYPPAGPNYSMAWSQTEKDVQCLITWDNAASAARKMHHAADNGLASVIVWETSQDVRQNDYLVTGQPVDLAKHSVIYGLGHYKDYPK